MLTYDRRVFGLVIVLGEPSEASQPISCRPVGGNVGLLGGFGAAAFAAEQVRRRRRALVTLAHRRTRKRSLQSELPDLLADRGAGVGAE